MPEIDPIRVLLLVPVIASYRSCWFLLPIASVVTVFQLSVVSVLVDFRSRWFMFSLLPILSGFCSRWFPSSLASHPDCLNEVTAEGILS